MVRVIGWKILGVETSLDEGLQHLDMHRPHA